MQKIKRAISTGLALCVLTLLVLAALIVTIAREFAPALSDYKPQIEQYLSEVSHLDVELEELEFSWPGLAPELRIANGRVRKKTAIDDSIAFSELYLQVDLLASLWNGAFTAHFARINGVDITLSQRADGQWFSQSPSTDSSGHLRTIIDALLRTNEIAIADSVIRFKALDGGVVPLAINEARLVNHSGLSTIDAQLMFGSLSKPTRFVSNFSGVPWGVSFAGDAFLDIRDQVFDAGLSSVIFNNTDYSLDIDFSRDLDFGGQLWFKWSAIDQVQMQAELDFSYLPVAMIAPTAELTDLSINLDAMWNEQYKSRVRINEVQFNINENRYNLPSISLENIIADDGQHLRVDLAEIQLDRVTNNLGLLADSGLTKILKQLDLRGELSQLSLDIPLARPLDMLIDAQLSNVSANAIVGAPKLTGVSGKVKARLLDGYIDIDANEFTLGFPSIYENSFSFEQAVGRVYWLVDSHNNRLLVGAKDLNFSGDIGDLSGAFLFSGLMQKNDDKPQLYLQLGLDRTHVKYHKDLVPFVVSEGLRDWLDSALIAGDVHQADFIYRGDLEPGCNNCSAIQLTVDAENASLSFLPDWPTIHGLKTWLYLDDYQLSARVDDLEYLGAHTALAEVDFNLRDPAPQVAITAELDGTLMDVIPELETTPLWNILGPTFSRWELAGDANGKIEILAPIDQRSEFEFDLSLGINDASLVDKPLNIGATNIQANFNISESDVNATAGRAVLWGKPVQFDFSSANAEHRFDFSSSIAVKDLEEWLNLGLEHYLSGESQFSGALMIAPDSSELSFSSTLKGMALDLPVQWAKPQSKSVDFSIAMPLRDDGFAMHINYDSEITAELDFLNQSLESAVVTIGEGVETTPKSKYWLALKANGVELPAVNDWVNRKLALKDDKPSVATADFGGEATLGFLRVNDDIVISNVELNAIEYAQLWNLDLSSSEVAGNILWPKGDTPAALNLHRINLPKSEGSDDAELNPLALEGYPAVDIAISSVIYDGTDYGSWAFKFRPLENGMSFSDILGRYGDLQVGTQDHKASLRWTGDAQSSISEMNFVATTDNFDSVKKQIGLDLPLSASDFSFVGEGQRAGAPYQFDLLKSSATIGFSASSGKFGSESDVNGAMRLFSVLNFNTWARRLKLDFSDLEKDGVAFDSFKGGIELKNGLVSFSEPVTLESPLSHFVLSGETDLNTNMLDARLNVTLPVSNNVAWITALAVGLPAAAGVFLAGQVFEEQFDRLSTLSYSLKGPTNEPEIEFDGFFGSPTGEE